MTTTFGGIPIVTPADDMPGPGQGYWTYEAYAAIPDDGRCYEIVDGVLFMTPSPSGWHQKAAGRIFHYLLTHIEDAGLGQVFIAPLDVELTPKDVVQPDVFVLLNASCEKFIGSRIVGAPDLVVEVASPGTEDYDRYEKRDAYAHAGVLEYWVVDTMARTVGVMTTKAISRIVNQSRCQPKSHSCRMQRQKDSLSYPLTRSMGKGSPSLPVG